MLRCLGRPSIRLSLTIESQKIQSARDNESRVKYSRTDHFVYPHGLLRKFERIFCLQVNSKVKL